ncbi:amino acid permease [Eisenibacter elegans]|uniref:amino acid permease n=1 Tax=Eisenibacter elegans TaxID=997 RepID=UPI00041327CE
MKQLFQRKDVRQILADLQQQEAQRSSNDLHRNLKLRDLVSFGIAAVVGAGIFSTIGNASYQGGPAVMFLFIFTAIACLFSALCYAEFASTVPISGSAYTYAYTSFGELMAWVLGWALVMEYAVGNIAVAISWSDYFTGILYSTGIPFPAYLSMDYLTAARVSKEVIPLVEGGKALTDLTFLEREAYLAWTNAPVLAGNIRLIADIPALVITLLITSVVFVGIKESKTTGNIMVAIKLAVVLMVIVVGAAYVDTGNWSPFAPNGLRGILQGVSAVFFAYIGFDAISTTAEECENPQRDLPRAMIYSLIICTILYVLIALVLTGMVSYKELQVGDPLAYVFAQRGLNFIAGIVAGSAIVAMASVFLVFQLGQPRILMTMSRDGLLPKAFSKIHPRFQTPYIATIATGLMVAIPALFMNLTEVTDLTSIGTLFAFTIVSAGVLTLPPAEAGEARRFRVPYLNSRYFLPPIMLLLLALVWVYAHEELIAFFSFAGGKPNQSAASLFLERLPMWVFLCVAVAVLVAAIWKQLSLIPLLGLLTNFYLMTELGIHNWIGFGLWMLAGLVIYFSYGYWHSKMRA